MPEEDQADADAALTAEQVALQARLMDDIRAYMREHPLILSLS